MDESKFKSKISSYKLEIENYINEYFDKIVKDSIRFGSLAETISEKLREYTLRKAKRLRPILVIEGAKAFKDFKKSELKDLISVAISIELIQTSLLIHDDIIDDSKTRRGKPTFHLGFKTKEYGIKQAICAGDLAGYLAFEQILELEEFPAQKIKLLKKLKDIVKNTIHGEMLDVSFETRSILEISEEDIIREMTLKTAYYTIAGPLQFGAILSGIEENELRYEQLEKFGEKLGLAFQIQDDILGIFGNEEELGKSINSDIEEGKKTLLIKKTLTILDRGDKKNFILSSLGHHINSRDFEKLKEIISNSGALDETKKYSEQLINEAKEILNKIEMNKEQKEFLNNLCDYVVKRIE